MTPIQQSLLKRVESFIRREKMPPSTFGRKAVGASNLIYRLRDGANITTATIERVEAFMREYRDTAR